MTTNSYFHGAFSHIPPTTTTNNSSGSGSNMNNSVENDTTECWFTRQLQQPKRKTYDDRFSGEEYQPSKYARMLDDDEDHLVHWNDFLNDPFMTEEVISFEGPAGILTSSIFDTPPATPSTPIDVNSSIFEEASSSEDEHVLQHTTAPSQEEEANVQEPTAEFNMENEPSNSVDIVQNDESFEEEHETPIQPTPTTTTTSSSSSNLGLGPLLPADSIPSPVRRELTPSERNNIITNELMEHINSLVSGQTLMILSPERNRHKSYDIPRKDITASDQQKVQSKKKKSQDLKIGSGSEKKFKYFLHILFQEPQSKVPALDLTKYGSSTTVNGGLKIHHSWLLEGGLVARYSMSFQVNSFEHDRASFCITATTSSNTLARSVPFMLVARKTNDCLFHNKTTKSSEGKKKQKRNSK